MVLDSLSQKERQGLAAVFAVAVLASLGAGFMGGSMSSPTGAFTGEEVSQDEIRSTAQSIMDQQLQRQQQQLALMAQQNENISQEDLSIGAEVQDVSESDFPSLYRVTVSITGETPSQENPGEIRSVDQEQVIYLSKDGKYMFGPPTNLEEAAQQQQAPQQPPTGQ